TTTAAETTPSGGGGDGTPKGGTTTGDQDMSLSGVTIDYWDVMNVQSATASERVSKFISDFQKRTGARVQLNKSGYAQMSGQKWVSAWRNNNYPVAFNCEDFYFGRIYPTGNIKPFDSYKADIDDKAIDGMSWAMDLKQSAYRFWDIPGESGIVNFPHATGIRNPLTVRKDLLEQAGFSLDDIPDTGDAVKDWTGMMEMAKKVQKNSDAKWGFHGHATWPDYNDNMAPWMSAHLGQGSRYISEDGKTPYPSDKWAPWVKRFRQMIHKYGVSGPGTANASDESVANMMYAGDVAMSNVETLNYPTFIRRAPDLLKNGNLKILPYPGGNSGKPGHVGFHDSGLNKKPPNADRQRWDRKLRVGKALLNDLLGTDFQTGYPDMVGWMPIRQNLWSETSATHGQASNFKSANTTMLENATVTWPYHRFSNAIIFRTIAPYIQQALNQEISPQQAMSKARQQSNKDIQSAIDELGEPGSWPIK
ncbi:MAG: ABC transporter substrate-binding protein, partial [Haloarculaceae archaeon]